MPREQNARYEALRSDFPNWEPPRSPGSQPESSTASSAFLGQPVMLRLHDGWATPRAKRQVPQTTARCHQTHNPHPPPSPRHRPPLWCGPRRRRRWRTAWRVAGCPGRRCCQCSPRQRPPPARSPSLPPSRAAPRPCPPPRPRPPPGRACRQAAAALGRGSAAQPALFVSVAKPAVTSEGEKNPHRA